MPSIILKLNPAELDNPDLDIRYTLPELLVERSGGVLEDDGYDYANQGDYEPGTKPLLLFLRTNDLKPALNCILDVIETIRVLGNDLRRGITVAVEEGEGNRVIYPPNFTGTFTR